MLQDAISTRTALIERLVVATRAWSVGAAVDRASTSGIREELIELNHSRWFDSIPPYAVLAQESGINRVAPAEDVRNALIVSDDWFKSFDPVWLRGDFQSLSSWLSRMSVFPTIDTPRGATTLSEWRDALRVQGVYVTVSSATGGVPSLVPRDRTTLAALQSSSGVRMPWASAPGTFDLLALVSEGRGSGLQAGAMGLARTAHASHYGHDSAAWEFLRRSQSDGRPVVIFGAPARLDALLKSGSLPSGTRLPAGSSLVTGGGWKNDPANDLQGLLDRTADRLGLPRERCVDTYSTSELNTLFVSCAHGRYHVPPSVEVIVVDEVLRPAPERTSGRLAVLDAMAFSYPGLLATSDQVELAVDPCRCGRSGQAIASAISRVPRVDPRGCGLPETGLPR